LFKKGLDLHATTREHGLWVPAFAGTTDQKLFFTPNRVAP
jgi:hypothetical protein